MIEINSAELREIRRRFKNFYFTGTKHKFYIEERPDIVNFVGTYRGGKGTSSNKNKYKKPRKNIIYAALKGGASGTFIKAGRSPRNR